MDLVSTGLQDEEIFFYLNDIVLYARSLQEHETKFNKLVGRLRSANLKLQPDKYKFLKREVVYLGHIIDEDGVKSDPKKLLAVKEFPRPKSAKNVRQFLGLAGYYRRSILEFSKLAKHLTELLKKETVFKWDEPQKKALKTLRDALCKEPVLQYPDFSREFNVTTDASGYAIGRVLRQGPIGKDLPISNCSRLSNVAEKNYFTIERELLAPVYAIHYFRPYVYGREFTLITDHRPLVWLKSHKDPTSRLTKWELKLAEYSYKTVFRAGMANAKSDALSRNPSEGAKILPMRKTGNSQNNREFSQDSSEEINQDETFCETVGTSSNNSPIRDESDSDTSSEEMF